MSTRSTIAVKQGKKWKIIYCHSDGYNSYMVPLLLNYYNNQKAANNIVALGNLSYLDKSIDCPKGHSFDNRMNGYTVAYGRDRGEEFQEAHEYNTYKEALKEEAQAYNYRFNHGCWYHANNKKLKL